MSTINDLSIETDRLILRLFVAEDYVVLRELDTDEAVLRYRSRKTITPEMTRDFLDRALTAHLAKPRTYYPYAITLKQNRMWLGQCGLTTIPNTNPDDGQTLLWYSLLPKFWGVGYMTEAVKALIEAGFEKFGLTHIEGECDPQNLASARVMERVGMGFCGTLARQNQTGQMADRLHYEARSPKSNSLP